jgi:D-sedoheptulose 7-phosphate isomerase
MFQRSTNVPAESLFFAPGCVLRKQAAKLYNVQRTPDFVYFRGRQEAPFLKTAVDSYFEELAQAVEHVKCTGLEGQQLDRAEAYERTLELSLAAVERGNKLIFIGNGGSAAIASHMAIDFSKNGGMRAMCFNDGAALTCLGNDFGYEYVFSRQLDFHAQRGDVLYAISSSGRSPNILKAVAKARELGCHVVTMSGFRGDNPLRTLGDVNFYVVSEKYGTVEVAHTALIHAVVDVKIARFTMASVQSAV